MLSAIYGSRRPRRRPPSALEQHRAKRRSRPFRLAEVGAWVARRSKDGGAATPSAGATHVPLVVRSSVGPTYPNELTSGGPLPIDWPRLLAAGCPDPRSPDSPAAGELNRMTAPLVQQAFAADAGGRDRIVLVTSAGPGEGRTCIAISLALSLARARPVLLVDADGGPRPRPGGSISPPPRD